MQIVDSKELLMGAQKYRLAHLGEEPRAYIQIKPKPRFVAFGPRLFLFKEAIARGIAKAEDYY